jgi:uncharacterized damage-inducible protein DinB
MQELIEKANQELQAVGDESKAAFGSLSPEQLNWKSNEKSWSVAQCLDHLVVTHSLYFPLFEKLAAGDVKPTFWERVSPLSGFFGRFLIKNLDPANLKPMKTTSKAYPSSSTIDGDIVERFVEHQQKIIEALKQLPSSIDPGRTIITSPLMGLVTYSLDDTFTILVHHCRRHLGQAKRVTETAGFPR